MQNTNNNSAPVISFLIEHSQGTSELWVQCTGVDQCQYEPLEIVPISGKCKVPLRAEMLQGALELDEWMADHFEVFSEGKTVFDAE